MAGRRAVPHKVTPSEGPDCGGPPQLHAPGQRHAPHVITITTTAKFTCAINIPLNGLGGPSIPF